MCKGDTGESAKIKSTIHATKWSLVNSACYPASTAPTQPAGRDPVGKGAHDVGVPRFRLVQTAADEYSRAWCRSLQCTDDPDDVMTLAEMASAISAIGEEPIPTPCRR